MGWDGTDGDEMNDIKERVGDVIILFYLIT
jgi:hypothetical protein